MGLLDKYGVPTLSNKLSAPCPQYRFVFHMEDFLEASLQTNSIKIEYTNDPFFGMLHKTMEIAVEMRDIETTDTFNSMVKYASSCSFKKLKIEQINSSGEVIKTIYATIRSINKITTAFDYSKADPVLVKFTILCTYNDGADTNADEADE